MAMRAKATRRPKKAVNLMLDSGAFSAWKKGERLDLRAYIKFVQDNSDLLHTHVNLDVIPGVPSRAPGVGEIEDAAQESYKNYNSMRKAGLDPIPVFHFGEKMDWLRRLIDSGAGWIGLGGSVGKPDEARHRFFSTCFELISKESRAPKVHGFGATSTRTLFNFPWYSVDSTTWVMASAMGSILVPAPAGDGKGFDFTKFMTVGVTGERKASLQAAGLGGMYRAHLDRFLSGEGLELAQVRHNQYDRNYINIRCLMAASKVAGVKLFFSTWMKEATNQAPQLTAAGARDRLLSYYEVRKHEQALGGYIETGSCQRIKDRDGQAPFEFGSMVYRGQRIAALVARIAREEIDG